MAVITNTFQSTSAKVNREELSAVVDRSDPEDTPIYSTINKVSFKTITPEWATDSLAAPADNAQLEGDQFSFNATTPAVRIKTYTQIFRKSGIISNSQEEADNIGIEQIAEQKTKAAIELKKDVEWAIVASNAQTAGATRKFGSLSTWITSNASRGATGANGGYNTGTTLTTAPTPGTQRALTQALLDSVMQQGYQNGANFRYVFVSPYVKSVFVSFMSNSNVASFRYAVDGNGKNTIVSTADYYDGPYGKVMIMPNRVMSGSASLARNVFLVDPDRLEFGWFRKIKSVPNLANDADATKYVILGEGALKVKNEKGVGVVADVFGLTASS